MLFCEFHGVRQLDSTFVRHIFFFFLEKREREEKLIERINDRERERGVIEGSWGVMIVIRLKDKQLDRQQNFSIFFLWTVIIIYIFNLGKVVMLLELIPLSLIKVSVPSVLSFVSKINISMLNLLSLYFCDRKQGSIWINDR